jgi:hypoxanthine phosphoribosyltransferase
MLPTGEPDRLGRVLITRDEIAARVADLGQAIRRDYVGRSPLLVGVLKGAVVFASDLLRAVALPAGLDFMSVSSYGTGSRSSGVVRLAADLSVSIEGRDVIIVEDIIDTGRTIGYLRRNLATRHPRSLALCALPAGGRGAHGLRRLRHPGRVRRRLRAGPQRVVPEPPGHRGA